MHGVDFCVHAAGLEQIDVADNKWQECVKTSLLESEDVMLTAIDANGKSLLALSLYNAQGPIILYRATKLPNNIHDVSGYRYSYDKSTQFSFVRPGNVTDSRRPATLFFPDLVEQAGPVSNTSLDQAATYDLWAHAIRMHLSGTKGRARTQRLGMDQQHQRRPVHIDGSSSDTWTCAPTVQTPASHRESANKVDER